ncbi:MAG: hypothetical protein K1060chlam5_00319 [Candidatus Anoxychlamydiales bacterium]|nr:hypothetical protein [Candidatus Anoxychlamydiales bacterium]
MISFLKKLFLDNWQRKLLSIILAMIVWIVVNHSLSSTKIISDIPIKIINIPKNKTLIGLGSNGFLKDKITLNVMGNKNFLDHLTSNDLFVLIDVENMPNHFEEIITKKNLVSIDSKYNLERSIKKIKPSVYEVRLSELITEKVPIYLSDPIGEAPLGYEFTDIFPFKLNITITGPEEMIKEIKSNSLNLTFNLNNITKTELDALYNENKNSRKDVINYLVPTSWKKINIPSISSNSITIDDPESKYMRIDFIKKDLIPINASIPIQLFFPTKNNSKYNPKTTYLEENDLIKNMNDVFLVTTPLFAKGVSELFLDIIKDKIVIVISVDPKDHSHSLKWNINYILAIEAEKEYVAKALSEETDNELRKIQPHLREKYLKNRFRSFLNKFRLWSSSEKKLNLKIKLKNDKVVVSSSKSTK